MKEGEKQSTQGAPLLLKVQLHGQLARGGGVGGQEVGQGQVHQHLCGSGKEAAAES